MRFGADKCSDGYIERGSSRDPIQFERVTLDVVDTEIFKSVKFRKSDRVSCFDGVVEDGEDLAERFGCLTESELADERNCARQASTDCGTLRGGGDDRKAKMDAVEFCLGDLFSVFRTHGVTATVVDGVGRVNSTATVSQEVRSRKFAAEQASTNDRCRKKRRRKWNEHRTRESVGRESSAGGNTSNAQTKILSLQTRN